MRTTVCIVTVWLCLLPLPLPLALSQGFLQWMSWHIHVLPLPFPSSAVSLDVGLSVLPALLLISPPHRTKIPNGTFWTQPNEADTVAYRCWSRSHSCCCCCCRDSGALVLVPPSPLSPLTLTTPLQLLLPLLLPAHLIWAADMVREEGRLRGSTWVWEGEG